MGEYKQFKKGEQIRTFLVADGKVNTKIIINGCEVCNPTLEQFYADGWEDYTPAPVPPYEPTRSEKINEAIREKYSANTEFMILRRYSANPTSESAKAAFDEYNAYVEEVIARIPKEE